MSSKNPNGPLSWYTEFVNKPSRGSPLVRTLANVDPNAEIVWKNKKDAVEYTGKAYAQELVELSSGEYSLFVNTQEVSKVNLRTGGVYSIIVSSEGNAEPQLFEITEPNSYNILWLIPQYVVMTLGEVMFSVTGLEFSYSQAPVTMKSVLQACWLLTVAFGNVIVVIIAEAAFFESQANEFFLFAGLMFVDMLIFMFMAYRYKPNNPVDTASDNEPLTDREPSKQNLDGLDNKSHDMNE